MTAAEIERCTEFKPGYLWVGGLMASAGLSLLVVAVSKAAATRLFVADLAIGSFGWGPVAAVIEGLALTVTVGKALSSTLQMSLGVVQVASPGEVYLLLALGTLAWLGGWGVVAAGIRRRPPELSIASEAVGAPLYPRLARDRDLFWGTLAFYCGGIVFSELAMILGQVLLAGGFSVGGAPDPVDPASGQRPDLWQLAPTVAFGVSLLAGFAIAFAGGFLGASHSRRLSTPEATLAIIYAGLPIPVVLTAMHWVPWLTSKLGYRLREVSYVSSLLGRPELGYWLVLAGLVLFLVLGITSGFVANSSGRLDLRAGFELFVATRHVNVFRPTLILGTFLVLIMGIIPPLLLFVIGGAAEAAVDRTRVRLLGLKDPLKATEALHRLRMRAQSPTAMMTALSVGGVGTGVMALIIVLSVMSGFETDLQQKILGTNAHAVVLKYSDSISDYPKVMEQIRAVSGVVGQTPFIMSEVMLASEGNTSGVIIKGIDPGTVGNVTDLPKNILPGGSMDNLSHPDRILSRRLSPSGGVILDGPDRPSPDPRPAPGETIEDDDPMIIKTPEPAGEPKEPVLPGLLLGRELAAAMKVVVGDRVSVVSPLGGELGPQGPMPKSRPFRVAGVFYSGMYEYDSKFAYILLEEAQSFFNVKGAMGIELKVADIGDARRIAKAVYDKLDGYPFRTKDWGEMNRNLFSALRLEKLVMAIILSIIVIVAAGLIVATVIMLVLEKRKEISVLKALGVSDGGIVKIFLAEGLQIGITGGVLGLLSGLAWCLFIERVGIKLDPEVYYIPALPVRIEPLQTAIAVVIAILVTFLASIYPALKASQVEPVEGLKAE